MGERIKAVFPIRGSGAASRFEGFIIHAAREFLDFINRVQNISNTVLPTSR